MATSYANRQTINDGLIFAVDADNIRCQTSTASVVINDLIPTGLTGSLVNGVNSTDKVWDFDGVNDYIDFGVIDSLNFNKESQFSVECWVKLDSFVNYGMFLGRRNIITDPGQGWYFSQHSTVGQLQFTMQEDASPSTLRTFVNSNESMSLNTWHHIAMTNNGTGASGITFHLDGVTLTLNTGDPLYLDTLTTGKPDLEAEFRVGAIDDTPTAFFVGKISAVKIYNKALTASEIKYNYDISKNRYI